MTGATFLQYVTRWQKGNVIYYVLAEAPVVVGVPQAFQYYAGAVQSIDLCSVSACEPHVTTYPDAPAFDATATQTGGFSVAGGTVDPGTGTITIPVPVADVGSPTQTSLLEEVGSYTFGSAHRQSTITNANAEFDQLPLEVDGACCFNFQPQAASVVPEAPWLPALLGIGGATMVSAGLLRRRRRTRLLAS